MSIDPPTTTDVDDCISFRRLGDGRYEVGVHIADVSYFVHQGSKLDGEARARGETVYLVEERLDMLPSTLSSNICSLLEGKDRLAVSCLWQIDDDCDVLSVSQVASQQHPVSCNRFRRSRSFCPSHAGGDCLSVQPQVALQAGAGHI